MFDLFFELLKGIASIVLYSWWIIALLLIFAAWQNRRKTKWVTRRESVVLEIKIPKTNDKNPTAAEMMFATLHGILKPKKDIFFEGSLQEHVGFEIVADLSSIRFFVWTPKHLRDFVEGQIYAQYPLAEITETEDYSRKLSKDGDQKERYVSGARLVLEKEDFLPIKTFNNFQVDPLAGITGALAKLEEQNEEIWIQILARPVADEWKRRGLNWVQQKKGGKMTLRTEKWAKWILLAPFKLIGEMLSLMTAGPEGTKQVSLSPETEGRTSAIEQKCEKLAYLVKIRIMYISPNPVAAREKIQSVFGAFKQFNTANLNGFKGKRVHNSKQFLSDYQNRLFIDKGYMNQSFHLNIEEIASIYHLPHTSVETPNINWTTARTGEPPTSLPTPLNTPEEDLALFAETNFRTHKETFGIKRDDRRRHMYIIGKSGLGKTKMMENLIKSDLERGEGLAVMDPHGDLAKETIKMIPPERINDVILFNPADTGYPIGFNPMEVFDENLKVQIAAGVVGTFKKIFGHSWGPRLEYVLNYTVLALLDTPGSTLIGIVNMLTDKNYRKKIIANIKDPVVKKFWTTEFASYSEKFATEAIAPILNKVGQFVANSLIRNVIGQPKSSFNIRQAMDEHKIILINLSQGLVGETNASLLGSLMVTALQLSAMSRADVAEEKRRDFFLYVDEFQNFATDSFKNILSEARKYRLSLIMANQYIAQLEDTGVQDAVFGNVGTMASFRVGAQDASVLEKEFNPPFTAQDLISLERQHIYIKMTIDGRAEEAFSAKVLTVEVRDSANVDSIVKHSREKYTKPKEVVEKEVAEWSGGELITETTGSTTASTESVSALSESDEETFEKPIIKGNKSAPSETDSDEGFEAPIVKRAKGKGKGAAKEEQKEKLAEIIKENTSHLEPKKTAEDKNPENKISQIADETRLKKGIELESKKPAKIKDKIDKETLSEILKQVVSPKESTKGKQQEDKPTQKNKQADRAISAKDESVSQTQIKTGESGKKKEASPEPDKKIIKPERKTEAQFPSSQNEKVITPDNFKKIKEIHPHEVVKVIGANEKPEDLKEGEEIKFR